MGELDVAGSEISSLPAGTTAFTVDTASTDGATGQKEYFWMNTHWSQDLGYYNSIPEVMGVIDAKASWTCGAGYTADPETEMLLDTIEGWGKDTFVSIIENMDRTREIGGDSYAHIIRDDEGILINLKPLDPGVMKHVVGTDGMLKRFEQTSKIRGKHTKKYKPEEIFYIPRNRIADEIHGNTMITRLADIILARNEAMADYKELMHLFVRPRWIIKLDTDKPAVIAKEKAKWDKANSEGKNMYIPMGSVEVEQMSISPNSTLNPLTWIENLNTYFYESAQVPRIVVGGSGGFTDAAVKIAYLGYEENIKKRQRFWEDQILSQLNLFIELQMPASLMNDMLSGQAKQGDEGAAQPNDITAEMEGKT